MKILNFYSLLILFGIICLAESALAQPMGVYCRFQYQNHEYYGRLEDSTIFILDNAPWEGGKETGVEIPLKQVKLLFPSEPTVIVGLSKSYKDSWKDKTPPKTVRWFIKPPSAAASPGEDIILPPTLDNVKVEAELVIIIGKKLKNADIKTAAEGIFGYTVGNDIVGTVDSYHRMTGESPNFPEKVLATGLKVCDRFAPFGPFIYSGIDWRDIGCSLNIGNPGQTNPVFFEYNTGNLLYSPEKIVSDLSRVLTLHPGDVIFTGTPRSFIAHHEDVITIKFGNLCTLVNKIVVNGQRETHKGNLNE